MIRMISVLVKFCALISWNKSAQCFVQWFFSTYSPIVGCLNQPFMSTYRRNFKLETKIFLAIRRHLRSFGRQLKIFNNEARFLS